MNEREKYEKAWESSQYRKYSPGERIFDKIANQLEPEEGDTLIDFGCGTGRAAQKFADMGLEVTGVDIAENALDEGVSIEFIQADITDESLPISAKFGVCTDVMEHIPTALVDSFLAEMHNAVEDKAFFQIAMFPDGFGRRLGLGPLHLTVADQKFWDEKLGTWWGSVESWVDGKNYLAVASDD